MQKLLVVAIVLAGAVPMSACQAIQIESFDEDIDPELVSDYRAKEVIVDRSSFPSALWRLYDGEVVLKPGGFSARQSYGLLPLGLYSYKAAGEYDVDGRLLSNGFRTSLLWGMAYTGKSTNAFHPVGTLRLSSSGISLLLFVLQRKDSSAYTPSGDLESTGHVTVLLSGLIYERKIAAKVGSDEGADRQFLVVGGLLGWSQKPSGEQSLHLLYIPIPLGGGD